MLRPSVAAVGPVLALASLLGAACSQAPSKPSDPVLSMGYDVFQANCAACHGTTGDGAVGPKLKGVVSGRFPNIADQVEVITNGRNTMPGWKDRLTAEQIEAVARYEREGL